MRLDTEASVRQFHTQRGVTVIPLSTQKARRPPRFRAKGDTLKGKYSMTGIMTQYRKPAILREPTGTFDHTHFWTDGPKDYGVSYNALQLP